MDIIYNGHASQNKDKIRLVTITRHRSSHNLPKVCEQEAKTPHLSILRLAVTTIQSYLNTELLEYCISDAERWDRTAGMLLRDIIVQMVYVSDGTSSITSFGIWKPITCVDAAAALWNVSQEKEIRCRSSTWQVNILIRPKSTHFQIAFRYLYRRFMPVKNQENSKIFSGGDERCVVGIGYK